MKDDYNERRQFFEKKIFIYTNMKRLKLIHDVFKFNNKVVELQTAQLTNIENFPNTLSDVYIYYNYLLDSKRISFTEGEVEAGFVDDYVDDYFV